MNEAGPPHPPAPSNARGRTAKAAGNQQAWPARFLSEVRAYAGQLKDTALAVAVFVAVIATIVGSGAAAGLPGWLIAALAALPFALPVGHYLATRPRRRPRLLEFTENAAPRYFRIGPYTAIDRDKYRRADGAHEQVRDWLLADGPTPRYLSGDSGAGKSSLLDAFVRPEFGDRQWRVAVARALSDPEAALRQALDPDAPVETATRDLIAAARQKPRSGRQRPAGLLLIIDQFEEFLILRQEGEAVASAADRFCRLLEHLNRDPIQGVRLLIVFRKEYQTDIDRTGLPPLRQGDNWREVDRFSRRDAVAFLLGSGLGLDEAQAVALVEGVSALEPARDKVRPITLNMLGHILAQGEPLPGRKADVGAILQAHIRRALASTGVRDTAPRLLPGLLTATGTKRARRLADLSAEAGLEPAEARTALLNLQAAGLVRPLGDPQEVWEVSHDYVAQLLALELASRKPRRWAFWQSEVAGAEESRRGAEAEARRELADLGVFLSRSGAGLQLEAGAMLDQARLDRAPPYLRLFKDRIFRADLSAARGDLFGVRSISDLAPLAGLTSLQSLELASSLVTDLAPLASLTALQNLRLSGSHVADLAPLAGLSALQTLSLSDTQGADLTPLASLTALQNLTFSSTTKADLAPLARLTQLYSLFLSDTGITDLAPLASLTALRHLNLSNTRVATLAPLANLTALRHLSVWNDRITELAPLSSLRNLKTLRLWRIEVVDLAPLASLTHLQELELFNTTAIDLSPVAQITTLKRLYLIDTPVGELTPLANLIGLESLILSDTLVAPETRAAFIAARRARGLPPLLSD